MAIIALAWLGALQPALADTPQWLYLGAGFGWDKAADIQLDSSDARMSFDQGVFQPSLALGFQTGGDWRLELERVVHHNAPEILYSSAAAIESDSDENDEFRATALMFNVLHDFRIGDAFRPYLGAGIGWSKVHLHFSSPLIEEPPVIIPRTDRIDDTDTALAFQLIAGFTVPVSRRFDMAFDYRYWSAPSLDFKELSGADLDTRYAAHSAWVHVRYHAAPGGVFRGTRPRAANPSRWYVAGRFGGAFAEDADIKGTESVIDAFTTGPLASVAIGYAFNDRWSVELAGNWQQNDIDVLEVSGAIGEDKASGELTIGSLMVNAIRHFAPQSAIRPYIGLGAGVARGAYDISARTFCRNFTCGTVEDRYRYVDDSANGFAAQAILGMEVRITPRISFTADYRYWRAVGFDLESPDGITREIDRQNSNSVTAGLRYQLGIAD